MAIINSYGITEQEVFDLPIEEFKEKLDRSIRWGVFLGGGELDIYGDEGREAKHDAEYNYLKSVGAL